MNTGLIITIVVCALLLLIGGGTTIYYATSKKQQSNNNYNDDFKLINEQEQTPTKETDGKSQSDKDKKELYDKNKDKAFKSILNTTTPPITPKINPSGAGTGEGNGGGTSGSGAGAGTGGVGVGNSHLNNTNNITPAVMPILPPPLRCWNYKK